MKKDVLWGYISQFLQYGSALLVLPLLLRKLSSAELGIWYVFMTISTLVNLLDMGFTPTLARNVSYVLGGAKRLLRDGHEVSVAPNEVDYGLLKAIIGACRNIFLVVSLLAFLILVAPGTLYILHVTQGQVDSHTVLIGWAIFVSATVINLYYKYFTPLLQGRGLYAEYYKSSTMSNLGFIAVTAILLQVGLGLIAVACGFMVSTLIGRWSSGYYLYDKEFKQKLNLFTQVPISERELFLTLWHNAWRLGINVTGAFLILRANTLLSAEYLGLSETASYAITLQVLMVLSNVSTVYFGTQIPKIVQLRISWQRDQIVQLLKTGIGISWCVYIVGTIFLLLFGNTLIQGIGGKTTLLDNNLFIVLAITTLLEMNHSLAGNFITTGNKIPFTKSAIFSGLAVVFVSWMSLKFYFHTVAVLIYVRLVVQLAYNNWKWPLEAYKELRVSFLEKSNLICTRAR
jgi:O-antigen/teichoic acid export membrane protein